MGSGDTLGWYTTVTVITLDETWGDQSSVSGVKGRMVDWDEDCIWVVDILLDGTQRLLGVNYLDRDDIYGMLTV